MSAAARIVNLFWIVLGIAICAYSLRLKLWEAAGPGSGFLPFIVGAIIGSAGIALFLQQRFRGVPPERFWTDSAARNRVGLVVVALCTMAYLMPVLGFLLSAAIVMAFLLSLSEPGRIAQSLLLAGAASAAVYWLFASLLQVRLPTGWLGF